MEERKRNIDDDHVLPVLLVYSGYILIALSHFKVKASVSGFGNDFGMISTCTSRV